MKMKKILILFATTDGQTKLICQKIKKILEEIFIIDIHSIESVNQDLSLIEKNFESVIIGASIRYGKHSNDLYDFIKNNADFLEGIDNAFFSVNVVARKPEKNTPDTNPYIKKYVGEIEWSNSILTKLFLNLYLLIFFSNFTPSFLKKTH